MKNWAAGLVVLTGLLGVMGGAVAYAGSIESAPIDSNLAQPDYLLKACTEFSSGGGGVVDPAYMLKNFLQHRDKQYIELAAIKITMLEGAKHGELTAEIDNVGMHSYLYVVELGYLGKDKADFMAEFEGKRYKVVVNFVITEGIDDYDPQCPQPELIKLKNQ